MARKKTRAKFPNGPSPRVRGSALLARAARARASGGASGGASGPGRGWILRFHLVNPNGSQHEDLYRAIPLHADRAPGVQLGSLAQGHFGLERFIYL